jgi:hypothetical protein
MISHRELKRNKVSMNKRKKDLLELGLRIFYKTIVRLYNIKSFQTFSTNKDKIVEKRLTLLPFLERILDQQSFIKINLMVNLNISQNQTLLRFFQKEKESGQTAERHSLY